MAVALALGSSQSRRAPLPAMPDIVSRMPVQAASPAPAQVPAPVVVAPVQPPLLPHPKSTIAAPGSITWPPAPPSIPSAVEVASLDVRPAAPRALPEVIVPGPAPTYPRAAPAIEAPPIARLPDVVVPGTLAWPPPGATITSASLDVRPPRPPATVPDTGQSVSGDGVCRPGSEQLAAFSSIGRLARAPRKPLLSGVDAETFGRRLSEAAVAQTRDLVIYTARYQAMAYPMGDVVALHGACIDVVIRAYRQLGIDLQEEVQKARPRRGDPNIDHRRTENMRRFLAQKGTSLPVTSFPENYKPGDIVTYHRPFSRVSTSHIAIVTDIIAPTGRPMIVHNRGYGVQLEDALFVDRITGHYRYQGPSTAAARSAASQTTGTGAPLVRASFTSHTGNR